MTRFNASLQVSTTRQFYNYEFMSLVLFLLTGVDIFIARIGPFFFLSGLDFLVCLCISFLSLNESVVYVRLNK